MGNPLDENANKHSAALVTFTWGASTARYAAYTSDITVAPNTFTASPAMSIKWGKFDGSIRDFPTSITLPFSSAPADTLARPYPHAPVTVTIDEIDPEDLSTQRQLFKGTVSRVAKNPKGKNNVVRLDIAGTKSILESPLGLVAMTTCPWRFGDANCKIDLVPIKTVNTITNISGVTITLLDSPPGAEQRYWHRGYIEQNDVQIFILEANVNVLTLDRQPPPEWATGFANLTPGCDKTIETCRARWNNESEFCGCGYAIPGYSPSFGSEA